MSQFFKLTKIVIHYILSDYQVNVLKACVSPVEEMPDNVGRSQNGCLASEGKQSCRNGLRCIGSGDLVDRDRIGLKTACFKFG